MKNDIRNNGHNSGGAQKSSTGSKNGRLMIGHNADAQRYAKRGVGALFTGGRGNAPEAPQAPQAELEPQDIISPAGVDSLSLMEETTGYGRAKNEMFELLEDISQKQYVQQESLRSISTELSKRLEVTPPATILSLINALAPVDEYLQRHCVNVSLLNGLIGSWLGMKKRDIDNLVLIGLLHDCGKALIPPKVLMAPRKLTIIEFEVVKMHATNSYELLTDFPEPMRCAARGHHERISGFGYPDKLANEEIPLEARITAISDIYDAMVSRRAYKKPHSPFIIMATLADMRGTELDAELVDVFIANMPLELLGKHVMMSDGTIALVHSFDPEDPEYPMVEINGAIKKSCQELCCMSMYNGS